MRLVVVERADGVRVGVNPDHVKQVRDEGAGVSVDLVGITIPVTGVFEAVCDALTDAQTSSKKHSK